MIIEIFPLLHHTPPHAYGAHMYVHTKADCEGCLQQTDMLPAAQPSPKDRVCLSGTTVRVRDCLILQTF